MDPNVLAARIRALAMEVLADNDEGPDVDLAETVLDLFEWLARGGYAPDWRVA